VKNATAAGATPAVMRMNPGWSQIPLKRMVRLVGGHTPSTSNDAYWEGDIPWFSPKDMKARVLPDAIDHVSELAVAECGLQLIPAGTTLVVVRGMILAHTFPVCVTGRPGTINQDLKALIPDERIDASFLPWLLRGWAPIFLSLTDQSAHGTMALRTDRFLDELLMVPPTEDQAAIASYLDAETARIDDLIEAKKALLGSLIELKSARITEILTGAAESLVPTGDLWIPQIPRGWVLKRLKHIGQVRSGLAKGKKHDASTETLELPYMRVANVQDGHIDLSDVATLAVATGEVERYSLAVGDVLMNEGGDYDKLGRGAVWEGKISPCLHQNHVFAVRLVDVAWAPWVSALTRTAYAKFYFMNNSKQSTNLASISQSSVKEWPVVLPPEGVRDSLLARLTADLKRADDLIAHVEQELEALAELRSATITDAVLGRIDVHQHIKN